MKKRPVVFAGNDVLLTVTVRAIDDPAAPTVDRDDWQLHPEIFATLNRLWGPHTIDLFSSANNRLLRRRYTKDPSDTDALAVDAFQKLLAQENHSMLTLSAGSSIKQKGNKLP